MSDFTIRDPQSGKTVTVRGDSPPSASELEQIFKSVNIAPQPVVSPESEGSAVGRFAEGAWKNINPIAAVQGIGSAIAHPIDTAHSILQAQGQQFTKAKDLYDQGRHTEAAGHVLAGILPLLGPAAAAAGEKISTGDVAGGLGETFGLLAPFGAAAAVRGAAAVTPARAAEALDRGAAARVADVMSPKVGRNKVRFGNMAEKVAPTLAADPDLTAWSRGGFQANVAAKLQEATDALDAASDARLQTRTFSTKPIVDALLEKRKQFTAQAVEGSQMPQTPAERQLVRSGEQPPTPIGSDVVPAPNAARVAQIDQAIGELKKLGSVARFDDLKTIRQAYDGPAKAVYSPAVTADFLTKQGEARGAADVTGVLRERLASFDPQTAAANAPYSLYKTANDVLEATAEVERTRPKVGRQIMARLTGSVIGEQAGGLPGAAAGFVLGPLVDQALSSGATMKLQTARIMSDLAKAIRTGDVGRVTSLSFRIKQLVGQSAVQTGQVTNPSAPQTAPVPAQ